MNRREFLRAGTMAAAALAQPMPLSAADMTCRVTPGEGMLRVDGAREFLLGLYQVPKRPDALRQARTAGVRVVQRPPERAAYDELASLGLRGWSAVGALPVEAAERVQAVERIRGVVTALRDHPALLFWETEDEPTFAWKEPGKLRVTPEQIVQTARLVRSADPRHPLYLNHSPTHLVATLRRYVEGSDLIATDIYPVIPRGIREMFALWPDGRQGDLLNDTLSQVGPYVDKMRLVAGPDRAVLMVLQAFAWEQLREAKRNPAHVLYPTREQLRFMAWQAVVHGVNGLLWWGLSYLPDEAGLWDDLLVVIRELDAVHEALAAPPERLRVRVDYHETGHSVDRGLEWRVKRWGHDALLIAVNADPNPIDVTLRGLGGYRSAEAILGEQRGTRPPDGMQVALEPFGVRLWRLRREAIRG